MRGGEGKGMRGSEGKGVGEVRGRGKGEDREGEVRRKGEERGEKKTGSKHACII